MDNIVIEICNCRNEMPTYKEAFNIGINLDKILSGINFNEMKSDRIEILWQNSRNESVRFLCQEKLKKSDSTKSEPFLRIYFSDDDDIDFLTDKLKEIHLDIHTMKTSFISKA